MATNGSGEKRSRWWVVVLIVVILLGGSTAIGLAAWHAAFPPSKPQVTLMGPVPALGANATSPDDLRRTLADMGRTQVSWNTSFMKLTDDIDVKLLDESVRRGVRHHVITLEIDLPKGKVPTGLSPLAYIASKPPAVDNQLGKIARQLAEWQAKPANADSEVILRPLHEANGDWYDWGFKNGYRGNTPAQFKSAWYHIQGVMRQKFPGLKFFWCVNGVLYAGETSYADWYPGDKSVDYVGDDKYNANNGTGGAGSDWHEPDEIRNETIQTVRAVATDKPYVVGETATAEPWKGVSPEHSKAEWYLHFGDWMRGDARKHGIIAVCFFDKDKTNVAGNGNDWRIYPIANPATGNPGQADAEASRDAFRQATAGLP